MIKPPFFAPCLGQYERTTNRIHFARYFHYSFTTHMQQLVAGNFVMCPAWSCQSSSNPLASAPSAISFPSCRHNRCDIPTHAACTMHPNLCICAYPLDMHLAGALALATCSNQQPCRLNMHCTLYHPRFIAPCHPQPHYDTEPPWAATPGEPSPLG